jgi:2-oxoglutarate dehydrogenase E2 component (dihydrolipoamide succinyltransferase)
MADIEMPQLGETVTEGTITKWFKNVGDPIAEDEVLFEVSTDKVDSEVPSPVAGFASEDRVPEGDTVDVGTILAVAADAPRRWRGCGRGDRRRGPARGARASATPVEGGGPASAASPAAAPPRRAAPVAPPLRPPWPAPRLPHRPPPLRAAPASGSGTLSPLVRRLIADNGLDPA